MATTTNSTTHRNRSGDAQMTMIEAAYYRQQLSLGELSSLAEDQKANNEQMKAIRGLQDKLRTFLSAGGRDGLQEIDENEMAELVRDAAALGIDLTAFQQQLFPTAGETPQAARPASTPNTGLQTPAAGARPNTRGASEAELEVQADRLGASREPGQRTAAGPAQGGEVRRRWVGGGDDYEAARDAIENIQQSLSSALDDVKSDASSKELDIQRVSQEVSTWTQMASTMMKKFSDTVMSVVRNIG